MERWTGWMQADGSQNTGDLVIASAERMVEQHAGEDMAELAKTMAAVAIAALMQSGCIAVLLSDYRAKSGADAGDDLLDEASSRLSAVLRLGEIVGLRVGVRRADVPPRAH